MKIRRRLLVVGGFLAMVVVAALAVVLTLNSADEAASLTSTTVAGGTRQISISPGMSAVEIGQLLEEEGIVASEKEFLAEVRRQGVEVSLKPGVYDLSPREHLTSVVEKLAEGRQSEDAKLTIPEGMSIDQVAAKLEESKKIDGAHYQELTGQPERFAVPPVGDQTVTPTDLEGLLFPSTYNVTSKESAEDLIAAQLQAFREYTAGLPWERAAALDLTPYQIIIVASMIEKETAVAEERPLVAAVIYNRLKTDMRLDIDATVRFALKKWTGALTQSDLEVDSPYNTRRYKGLPPGPIASPGVATIEAALQPAQVDYLYYVLTKNDGRHFFTASYEEFLAAAEEAPQQ